jgi:antitoxin VapB
MNETKSTTSESSTGLKAELAEKERRLFAALDERGLDGVLVSAVRNVSWLTAGRVRSDIVLNEETGVGSLLLMRDGRRYLVADNIEVPRFRGEDLPELNYETLQHPWYESSTLNAIRQATGSARIGCDTAQKEFTKVDFAPLRYNLTDGEITRYRLLCQETAQTLVRVCHEVAPGMTEHEIASLAAHKLLVREITPTVLLVGTDERIYNFRHPIPTEKRLERYCMVVVCARRHGLICAVTRLVHFGEPPEELHRKIHAAARVHAALQTHSVPGTRASELIAIAEREYEAAGFADEWKYHHQGGAIGYKEREWVARPALAEIVQMRQAFAWNPTVRGTKVEDTIINLDNGVEVLTATPDFPSIKVEVNNRTHTSAGILIR